jgi:CRP-like cAMP-binding protein
MNRKIPISEFLRTSPLLVSLDEETQDALIPRFRPRPFRKGQTLIEAGARDRELLLLLAGTAEVYVRDGDKRFPVATLEAGAMVGEMSFFDAQAVRTADVLGGSRGLAAAMPLNVYEDLCASGHPAAAQLEQAVLQLLARRMQKTNENLADLLQRQRSGGGFLQALRRLFMRKE